MLKNVHPCRLVLQSELFPSFPLLTEVLFQFFTNLLPPFLKFCTNAPRYDQTLDQNSQLELSLAIMIVISLVLIIMYLMAFLLLSTFLWSVGRGGFLLNAIFILEGLLASRLPPISICKMIISCGATLYTVVSVCLSVCLSVPNFRHEHQIIFLKPQGCKRQLQP